MSIALRFDNLTLGYDQHPAVHHLDGVVEKGALLAVCGPNGAGKSTLLKAIVGSLHPIGGGIYRESVELRQIAYLPQAGDVDRSFPVSVFDLVAMGMWKSTGMFGGFGRDRKARIAQAIQAVGLQGFEDRFIGTLSGGQMQRALFARLLLQDASLILLDEPFTAIDSKTMVDLLALVARWHGEKRTVIAVLHDMEVVREHFPDTLLLARSVVAWGPTRQTLSAANLLKARQMIEAFDRNAPACTTRGA